jgi:hypothetical protein
MNDCPFPVTAVVVGLYPHANGRPATVVATSCKLHMAAIAGFVGEDSPDDCFVADIEALPRIVEEMSQASEDVYLLQYQAV